MATFDTPPALRSSRDVIENIRTNGPVHSLKERVEELSRDSSQVLESLQDSVESLWNHLEGLSGQLNEEVEAITPIATSICYAHEHIPVGGDIGQGINACAGNGVTVVIIAGDWPWKTPITGFVDKKNWRLIGSGDASRLLPVNTLIANAFDVSGARDFEIADFQIDGVNHTVGAGSTTIIYGDGTATNPTYGRGMIRGLTIVNETQQTIGIGANAGKVVEDIAIIDNVFRDFGSTSFGAHPIDTGAGGTKRRFSISRNKIHWSAQPVSNPFNGIFCGHGTNFDFVIADNQLLNSPADGIQIYARPFGSEQCSFVGCQVVGNVIDTPGWSGIAVYGAKSITVAGNSIRNPGGRADAASKSAIAITNGTNGDLTKFGTEGITIAGNTLIDDQGVPAMQYAVAIDNQAGAPNSGVLGINDMRGYTIKPIFLGVENTSDKWSILRHVSGRIGLGLDRNPAGMFDSGGDVVARFNDYASQNIFTALVTESLASASGFFSGLGLNVRYNRTTARWEVETDATSNAFGALLFHHGTGELRLFLDASTGGTSRSLTHAQFTAFEQFKITDEPAIVPFGNDIKFKYPVNTIFISPSIASNVSPNFLMGWAINVRRNTATGLWESGNDGVNNAVAAMMASHADGAIKFFVGPTTGGTSQTFTDAAFIALERARIDQNGDFWCFGTNSGMSLLAAKLGKTALRFQQGTGEEADSGSILVDAINTMIIGKGTSASNRRVRLYDCVGIGHDAPTSQAGVLAILSWLGVGTNTITSGYRLEVVGGKTRLADVVRLDQAGITATRPLKVDASKDVISGKIDLASSNDITGILGTANGGTGAGGGFAALHNVVTDGSGNIAVTSPSAAIADLTGTADGTYDSVEQTMLNDIKTKLNAALQALRDHRIIS